MENPKTRGWMVNFKVLSQLMKQLSSLQGITIKVVYGSWVSVFS